MFIREEPKLSALNSLVQAVEDAESFVQDFPEVSYEVSKTLHGWVGKKVIRRLKLTPQGIANLRRSGTISSLYEYDRIIRVTMSNITTMVIEYKGAKHPYTYSAPVRAVCVCWWVRAPSSRLLNDSLPLIVSLPTPLASYLTTSYLSL